MLRLCGSKSALTVMSPTKPNLLPLPLLINGAQAARYIYIKPHTDGNTEETSLFVAGLPVGFDRSIVQDLFGVFGNVSSVVLHPSQTSAIVVFAKASGPKKVLQTASEGKALQLQLAQPSEPFGLRGWVEAHKAQTPGNSVLQRQLDQQAEELEAAHAAHKAAAAEAAAQEGWTLVTRTRGRHKISDGKGASIGSVATAAAQAMHARKPQQQHSDFYRFQKKDKRRSELLTLQERFKQDQEKVAARKAARRFKPY